MPPPGSLLGRLLLSISLGLIPAASAMAQNSTLNYDFETLGQWDSNFRILAAIGTGSAAQTTVNSSGIFRQDVTSGTTSGVYLFDQTPADTSTGTQSTFATSGPITVSFSLRAVATNSSFSVVFIDPANTANNLIAVFNLITGGDTVRFFKDGTLVAGNVGNQSGTTVTQTTPAEPNSGNFTSLSVSLSVSGTTPTITVTPEGATATTYAFSAGDFDFNSGKTLVALRLNDPSTNASTPVDIDNIIIASASAPDNAPGPPEDNVAPTLPSQTSRTVAALDTLLVTNTGNDPNTPPQALSYQLTSAPAGASISSSGVISWTPTPGQVSASPYTITTLVTDSGMPPLTASNSFEVTVSEAPVFEYSQTLDFTNASDVTSNFRILSNLGGGTFGASGGSLAVDARSNGGSTSGVLLYDTTPGDAGIPSQTAFPTNQQIRVSFLARASTANSTFSVSFSDPRNASNRVSASFILRAGDDTVRFHRDGTLTATSSNDGTQVGSDSNFDAGAEPASGNFVPVTVIMTVSGTTPTLTVLAGSGTPVSSSFVTGDIDWNPTLVLLRFVDSSTSAGALEIDNLLVAGGNPVVPPAPTLPPGPGADGNLITVNPSFETGSLNNFSGSYNFTGWSGTNAAFSNHALNSGSVAAGTTTNGTKKLLQSWGGTLTTSVTARPPATPGTTYELTYDQRALIRNFPSEKLGSTPTIEFFDAVGVRIKSAWNFAGRYRVQDSGKDTWETFTVRAVAPPGTAYVGLFFNNPAGRFVSNEENYTQDRHVEMDNIRLKAVLEAIDRLAYRRAPRLVEPGRTAKLKIHHVAVAPRTLRAVLLDATGNELASSSKIVPAGRFRATPLDVVVPGGLPNGTYSWRIDLLPTSGPAVASLTIPGVLIDQSVATPDLNGTDFRADNSRVQYIGRIEQLANGSRWLHWHGSEVLVRFSGTSLSMTGAVGDNGFGGYDAWNYHVVINEDYAAPIAIAAPLNGSTFTRTLVSGLPDGNHTARIYKGAETNLRLRLDSLRTDPGRGLLLPEPASNRRLEAFGDSVTSGSSAGPAGILGYADVLGRELDARMHIISKGGTGVAASFSGLALLGAYWDNLAFPNTFNGSNTSPGSPWDFSSYTPDLVLIGIGHNDQFNGGAGTNFNTKYADFKGQVRAAYPGVGIVSLNSLISNSLGHFQNALDSLIAGDPKHVFAYQPTTWVDGATAHPPTDGHAAMVYGDERRYSLAEVVEDAAGWGLDTPLNDYETWAINEFSREEIIAGLHAPQSVVTEDGVSNLMRYALGETNTGAAMLPTLGLDPTGRVSLTFSRARLDVSYTAEVSSDLVDWEPIPVGPGQINELITVIDDELPTPARFIRLRVERP